MKVITREQVFDDFAFLIEITDNELALVVEHPEWIMSNTKFMAQLCQSKGNNAHVLQITLNTETCINKYIEKLLQYYDSVSWYNPDHKFFIRRKSCHLSLLQQQ